MRLFFSGEIYIIYSKLIPSSHNPSKSQFTRRSKLWILFYSMNYYRLLFCSSLMSSNRIYTQNLLHQPRANHISHHLVPNIKCNRGVEACFHTVQLLKILRVLTRKSLRNFINMTHHNGFPLLPDPTTMFLKNETIKVQQNPGTTLSKVKSSCHESGSLLPSLKNSCTLFQTRICHNKNCKSCSVYSFISPPPFSLPRKLKYSLAPSTRKNI